MLAGKRINLLLSVAFLVLILAPGGSRAADGQVTLQELVNEALGKNPEVMAAHSKFESMGYRIPQEKSLPDPMVMFGYQNEGTREFTFGEMPDSQWMFSVSQMFPFPGKRPLKGMMAESETEGMRQNIGLVRLNTVTRLKELYYDLFLAHRQLELIREKTELFSRIEEAALARYASGRGMQQDVLMTQSEKYMLLEAEEMSRQKIEALEAMLGSVLGRTDGSDIGKPAEPVPALLGGNADELIGKALAASPDLKSLAQRKKTSELKEEMAHREFYPDFTITGNYMLKGSDFEDMWSLTTAFSIPIFYKTKQSSAVLEAKASIAESDQMLEAKKLMIASGIRENLSMMNASEKLMNLYRDGIIPKLRQDYEASLSAYGTGSIQAFMVISRIKALIDTELSYWTQLVERQKASARIKAMIAVIDYE